MNTIVAKAKETVRSSCSYAYTTLVGRIGQVMVLGGVGLLVTGLTELSVAQSSTFSEADYNDELVRGAVGNLFKLIEGAFGALIMVVAGLGAIVAAAMGAYRAAVGMLVVVS